MYRFLSPFHAFLLCFLLVNSTLVFSQGHEARMQAIDIQHYVFEINLFDNTDEIRGKANVTVKFLKEAKAFELDLSSKNEAGKGMEVLSVLEGDQPVIFTQSGEFLEIKPFNSTVPGQVKVYVISYKGIPTDGLIISENAWGERTFFGDNWPNRAHHWLPTVDHPSDKATVEFIVTAPNHYQVVGNGRLVEETMLKGDRKLSHWRTLKVIPTKVMVIGAADFAVQYAGDAGLKSEGKPIPVSSWVFREQKQDGFFDYALAIDVLDWFISKVGPYPFEKLANVQSKTRFGGMENASCIFYNDGSVDGKRSSEGLIVHEVAHQWFGNSASEATWYHLWLSEGFATFFTHLYYQDQYGEEQFRERLKTDRETIIGFEDAWQRPVIDSLATDYMSLLNPNSYQKGGWFLHMLREKLGDDAFFRGIKNYYEKYQYGNANTDQFRVEMERVSSTNLRAFFDQWLRQPGYPKLEMKWSYNAKKEKCTVTLIQKQTNLFDFPFQVKFSAEGGQKTLVHWFPVSDREKKYTIEIPFEPDLVTLDPEVKLLFDGFPLNEK